MNMLLSQITPNSSGQNSQNVGYSQKHHSLVGSNIQKQKRKGKQYGFSHSPHRNEKPGMTLTNFNSGSSDNQFY